MSDLTLRFLPWLRRGLARSIAAGSSNATITFRFNVGGAPVSKALRMRGPGDVVGIDPAQVIRTEPRPNIVDFEPNYFPYIEFVTPDLLWMFTPTAPDSNRLLPWVSLVTVKESLVSIGMQPNAPLPVLTTPLSELPPDLSEMWAWAHVQTTHLYADGDLGQALSDDPQAFISRVISPRNLQPSTSYLACLVPTYDAGVLAGRGLPVPEDTGQTLAWQVNDPRSEIELPVYYSWSFVTGTTGDFELLVERLQPRELNETVGRRDLSLANSSIPASTEVELPKSTLFFGALVSPTAIPQWAPWPPIIPPATGDPLRSALYDFLTPEVSDHVGEYNYLVDDPVVTPPHYGHEQLSGATLPPPKPENVPVSKTYTPLWYSEVNTHPRTRGAAGLGARIVRQHQEDFMARAWEEVTALRSINQTLQQGVYASLVAERWQGRVSQLEAGALLALTRNAHTRILPQATTKTVWGQLRDANLPNGTVSGDLQRLIRSGSVTHHALQLATQATAIQHEIRQLVVEQPDRLAALSVYHLPAGAAVQADEVSTEDNLPGNWYAEPLAQEMDLQVSHLNDLLNGGTRPVEASIISTVLTVNQLATGHLDQIDQLTLQGHTMTSAMQSTRAAAVNLRELTDRYIDDVQESRIPGRVRLQVIGDQTSILQQTLEDWAAEPIVIVVPPVEAATTLEPIAAALNSALTPAATISTHLQSRIELVGSRWGSRAIPTRFTASPTFEEAVYPYVCELSPEYMLPGLGEIEQNTVGLVEVNGEFVESVLIALNQEMSREMRWREYPADLTGTWFKHFWTPTLPDIADIKGWEGTNPLGKNLINFADDMLVLLIKGEILQRYPNLAVYAVKAIATDVQQNGATRRMRVPVTPEEQVFPAFSGELENGVKFFGFDTLTREVALGQSTPENNATDGGYFFALQEQPSEPRFGLDEAEEGQTYNQRQLATWSELSWGHFITEVAPDGPAYLTLANQFTADLEKPDTAESTSPRSTWGSNAGAMARIVLQRPVRMLVHASAMLP